MVGIMTTNLFEKQDSLNAPIESFLFDVEKAVFPVKPHWHYFAEVLYVLSGSLLITCDEKECIVSEGEMMILPPSSIHSIFSGGNTTPLFSGLKFDTAKFPNTSSYAPSVTNIFKYAFSKNMSLHFDAKTAESLNCREIFAACNEEADRYLYGRDVMLRSQVYRLLVGIVRCWIMAGLDLDKCPVSAGDTYGIENISEYIDKRLNENLQVQDIAGKCHMSYSGFAAKFKSQYGMSCREYIERMRIFKAEEYLLFTEHDLSFIAEETGFSDCSHFIRIFKRHRGVTPKHFRNMKKRE